MSEKGKKLLLIVKNMKFCGIVLLLTLMFLFAGAFLQPNERVEDASEKGTCILPDCEITQSMCYARCAHQVTRRMKAPAHVIGLDKEAFEQVYKEWQCTLYSKDKVHMERTMPLYCPLHFVLMYNETGKLAVYQNKEGDYMAWISDLDYDITDFDEETQDKLTHGMGFDSIDQMHTCIQNGL